MYVKVRVIAGAKKEEIIMEKPNYFKIFVREKAERNEANSRVLELVARKYGTTINKIRIINGHQSPSKLLSIDDGSK